jgi:D-psicose/D-tagatose/L-ribulose 3-epimerase
MSNQHFEEKNAAIHQKFDALKKSKPKSLKQSLNLSWSNWGFGLESLADTAKRLEKAGLSFIELHGNHYGPDLGYEPKETLKILGDHGIKVSGICGMFSADNDLSSNRPGQRQAAITYLQREIPFTQAVGGSYLLVVPAAVGRPGAYDAMEFERSVETLQDVADLFVKHKIKAAIEPIRSAETSLTHTVADAKRYIAAVNHAGVTHINGDVYHMQSEESHIGAALLEAGAALTNLHFADSNRCALGEGSLDVDTIIRALYVLGYNSPGKYVTFEPLGPGGDPYPAMYGKPNPAKLDPLVNDSVRYFREREEAVLSN